MQDLPKGDSLVSRGDIDCSILLAGLGGNSTINATLLVRLVLVLHLPLGPRLQNSWTVHEPPRIMPFYS